MATVELFAPGDDTTYRTGYAGCTLEGHPLWFIRFQDPRPATLPLAFTDMIDLLLTI